MRRKGQQFIAVLAAAGLLLSTAACGTTRQRETAQTGGGTAEEGTQAVQTAEAEKERRCGRRRKLHLISWRRMWENPSISIPENHVQDKMAEDIGVRIHMVNADNDKFNVLLAGRGSSRSGQDRAG